MATARQGNYCAYSGMLRRSEIVALQVEDVAYDKDDGSATITIRRSKTDQEGRGRSAYLPAFAVLALRRWLKASGIKKGPLFRRIYPDRTLSEVALSEKEIPRIFKRNLIFIGVPKSEVKMIAGHSARIGGPMTY